MPHKDPQRRKEYQAAYRERNRLQIAKMVKAWRAKKAATDPEWVERRNEDARKRYCPKAGKARYAVRMAVKRGEIVKPDVCEECNEGHFRIEAAHTDYSRPLDIRWLCASCHRRWDLEEPKGGVA